MPAPLTGIHAYYINAKPVYAAFLSDVEANGGDTSAWQATEDFTDGYFAQNPWVGVVIQKNQKYEGATAQYQARSVVLSDSQGIYPAQVKTSDTFQTAFAGYFGKATTDTEDYFGAEAKRTEKFTVSLCYGDIEYSDAFLRAIPVKKGSTSWSEIVTNYGSVFVDDVRMKDKFQNCPAQFFEETFFYFRAAIPRFNLPLQIVTYLTYSAPFFSFYAWAVPATIQSNLTDVAPTTTKPITIHTRQAGYEICSVVIYEQDRFGNPIETPYTDAVYDRLIGDVTFPAGIPEGTQFRMYFATDGYFDNKITDEMKRLLGLAFQLVWENRFSSDWLSRAAKITDKSFAPPNEANWTREQEEKRRGLEATFNDELWRYEQNCNYQGQLSGTGISLL